MAVYGKVGAAAMLSSTPRHEQDEDDPQGASPWTEGRVTLAALGVSLVVILVGLHVRFDYPLTLPPKPPPPAEMNPDDALRALDQKPEAYKQYLEKDVATYHSYRYTGADGQPRELVVPPETQPADLQKVFPYEQTQVPQTIGLDESFETATLKLSVRADTLDMRMGHEGTATFPHIILRIENKTDVPVAFNVITNTGLAIEKCMEKSDLPGDQLALPPHGFIERTECIYVKGMKVSVSGIEDIQLPAISFFYVSRLNPAHIGADKRIFGGHRVPVGKMCTDIPEQSIHLAIKTGQASWHDIIDFYARHNCDRYNFFNGYHAFSRPNQIQLPASVDNQANP